MPRGSPSKMLELLGLDDNKEDLVVRLSNLVLNKLVDKDNKFLLERSVNLKWSNGKELLLRTCLLYWKLPQPRLRMVCSTVVNKIYYLYCKF